jgi:small subunit ribosomal protein S20
MANHVSALKRVRQTEKRTVRNRNNSSRLKTSLRGLREALAAGDATKAADHYRHSTAAIDKAVKLGVIHGNAGSRYKSRLSTRLKAMSAK